MIMALPFCVYFNAEPAVNENEMLGPISSEKEEFQEDTNQKGQEENEAAIASEDNNDKKIDVPSTSGQPSFIPCFTVNLSFLLGAILLNKNTHECSCNFVPLKLDFTCMLDC